MNNRNWTYVCKTRSLYHHSVDPVRSLMTCWSYRPRGLGVGICSLFTATIVSARTETTFEKFRGGNVSLNLSRKSSSLRFTSK